MGVPTLMHSWGEFKVLKIYSEDYQTVLAYAQLAPLNIQNSTSHLAMDIFTVLLILLSMLL